MPGLWFNVEQWSRLSGFMVGVRVCVPGSLAANTMYLHNTTRAPHGCRQSPAPITVTHASGKAGQGRPRQEVHVCDAEIRGGVLGKGLFIVEACLFVFTVLNNLSNFGCDFRTAVKCQIINKSTNQGKDLRNIGTWYVRERVRKTCRLDVLGHLSGTVHRVHGKV